MSLPFARQAAFLAAPVLAAILLSGCAAQPSGLEGLASQRQPTSALDDRIPELPPKAREEAIDFGGPLDTGGDYTSSTSTGRVVVVNFWYAACPPCRVEAPLLSAAAAKYAAEPVDFIGVNVRDSADTARSFEREFDIPYPSILDQGSGAVQLAFRGKIAPNAVPTTLVLDRTGRVAARVVGQLPDQAILDALVDRVVAE